ncbi:hypothetical protein IQ254_17290 [Nodosilinea sp. LEGE 07088]|uniref:hypothetical protein n=1 Tax=Nodosilinea sp. LEGE 07088 TaxID=2777968 RepID=UPI0018811277|nr:hypothetical protein [Nodosilinea sp. LEGE 07088]MBE9138926.1 hypothetical protein [Nodosilinea sp. LEGE 07088]
MELYQRLEQILGALRPAFSHDASFRWFVLLVWGVLLNTQPPPVVLALELPTWIWSNFPHWFRTLPKHGYPSERIVQLVLQHQAQKIFLKRRN